MKLVKVIAYDDIDAQADELTEASEIDVPVRFGDIDVVVDLTAEHYMEVGLALKAVLEAGLARLKREQAAAEAAAAASRKAGKASPIPPVVKFVPYPVGSRERSDYLKALRWWADTKGRSEEYHAAPGTKKRTENQYHYPKKLLLDYNAWIVDQAKQKAS